MADYINPTSIRPEYAYKPAGFLAGMDYAKDRQRYEDVSSLQDYMMKNDASMSGMKLQDYQMDAPVREAKRLADVATANATANNIGTIKSNEAQKGTLENDLASGTLKSKISEAIANAALKSGEAGMQDLQRGAAVASALAQAAGSGPGAMAAVMQHLTQNGANPQLLQFFQSAKDPKDVVARAKLMQEAFAEADVKHKQALQIEREKGKTQERVAGIQAQAARDVAEIRQKAKQKDAEQTLAGLAGKGPDAIRPIAAMIMNDQDVDVKTRIKAETLYKEATDQINARAKGRPGDIPGLPPTNYPTLPGGSGGGGAQTNTGIPGVQRLP